MTEKRAYERKAVNLQANIVYGNEMYSGTVLNLSEKGAYFETGLRFPFKMKYKIFLHLKPKCMVFIHSNGNSIKVIVKTRRLHKIDHHYNGIGLEVLNPDQEYYALMNSV